MIQIWGSYQRFEFDGLSLQLSLARRHYRITDGESRLDRIGYDRIPDPDLSPGMFYGYVGASHTEGPAHPTPYRFQWQLNNLSLDEYAILSAIIQRSRQAKAPIRLFDSLIALNEVAPRTRAKVGSYEENAHGMEWFFPVFNLWIETPPSPTAILGRYSITLEGREFSPDAPIPITEDAPT